MSKQRYISTSFWDDAWIMELDPSEKLLYLYLMTNPLTTIAGIYEITLKRISFDTGFDRDMVTRILTRFQEAGKAYRYNEYIILPTWPKHQHWQQRSKIKQGIENELRQLPTHVVEYAASVGYEFTIPSDIISIPYPYHTNYRDTDTDTDTDSDRDAKPSGNADAKHHTLNVPMNKTRYDNLCSTYSQPIVDEYIQRAVDYCNSKGKKYYSDFAAAAAQYIKRDEREGKGPTPVQPDAQYVAVCKHCGHHNAPDAHECTGCGSRDLAMKRQEVSA